MIRILIIALALLSTSFQMITAEQKQGNGSSENNSSDTTPKTPEWPKYISDTSILAGADKHFLTPNTLYLTYPDHQDKSFGLVEVYQYPQSIAYSPVVPETVILNGKQNTPNPLYNDTIFLITELGKRPLVAVKKEPNRLFRLDTSLTTSQQQMSASEKINDAQENESAGIIACLPFDTMDTKEGKYHSYIALAVKPHEGSFGDSGSGIGLIKYNYAEEKIDPNDRARLLDNKKPKRTYFFQTLNTQNGMAVQNKATAFDIHCPALSVENGLASLGEHVSFEWNSSLNRLYIGTHVTTRPDASHNQGAHALAVARIHNNVLSIDPIISTQSSYKNSPFSAFGPSQQATVHHIKSLHTTTGIDYLIVVGGKGPTEQTSKQVLAVPLVNKNNRFEEKNYGNGHNPRYLFDCYDDLLADPEHGSLGSKNGATLLSWRKHPLTKKFNARFIEEAIHTEQEMALDTDQAVKVGADIELPHAITSIHCMQDAVFVTIGQDGLHEKGGIFHSQAIFDGQGKIAAWTPWQRVTNFFGGVDTIQKHPEKCETLLIETKTKKIIASHWNAKHKTQTDSTDLSFVISKLFAESDGIQSCIDIPYQHPGLGTERVSFIMLTGNKKIVLAEIAAARDESFCNYPNDYVTNLIMSNDGTLNNIQHKEIDYSKPIVLDIHGGALDQLGKIYTAAIYTNGNHAWLIVGGTGGMAILADQEGNGWDCSVGLKPHFAGLSSSLYMHKIGNFGPIKKIIADEHNLYVLTHKELSRITLTPENIKNNNPETAILAQSNGILGIFSDLGISGPLALLATSKGLFANSPYTAVSLQDSNNLSWNMIDIPHMQGQIQQLFFVSTTPLQTGFGKTGQVYILSGSIHKQYSSIHRIFVNDISEGIKADSITAVPDFNFQNYNQGIFNFYVFKNIFFTDGFHYILGQNNQNRTAASLGLIDIIRMRSDHFRNQHFNTISLQSKKAKNIRSIVRCSATGSLLVAGDFGLLVHDVQ